MNHYKFSVFDSNKQYDTAFNPQIRKELHKVYKPKFVKSNDLFFKYIHCLFFKVCYGALNRRRVGQMEKNNSDNLINAFRYNEFKLTLQK